MRLIDADKLIQEMHRIVTETNNEVIHIDCLVDEVVGKAPTVDAVPVVRCKNCKQWRRNIGFTDSPNGHCFCIDMDTNQYDFCSCGERRE